MAVQKDFSCSTHEQENDEHSLALTILVIIFTLVALVSSLEHSFNWTYDLQRDDAWDSFNLGCVSDIALLRVNENFVNENFVFHQRM